MPAPKRSHRPDIHLDLVGMDLHRFEVRVETGQVERQGLPVTHGLTLGVGRGGALRLEVHWRAMGRRGDMTIWDPRVEFTPKPAPRDLLARFVGLAEAPPEEILAFARRWGLLEICRHGRPAWHYPSCRPCEDIAPSGRTQWEPIGAWHRYARLAKELLEIAADLADGLQPPAARWQAVQSALEPENLQATCGERFDLLDEPWLDAAAGYLDELRWRIAQGEPLQALAACLRIWLRYGNVETLARVGPTGALDLSLESDGLVGRLALQLFSVIAGRTGVYRCDVPDCGRLIAPARKPQAGRAHYCERHSAAGRAAKRAWWNRNKSRYRVPKRGQGKEASGGQAG